MSAQLGVSRLVNNTAQLQRRSSSSASCKHTWGFRLGRLGLLDVAPVLGSALDDAPLRQEQQELTQGRHAPELLADGAGGLRP